jgi:hypothetical protein
MEQNRMLEIKGMKDKLLSGSYNTPIIMGLSLTGLTTFVTLYDLIDSSYSKDKTKEQIEESRRRKEIFVLVISLVGILAGGVLYYMWKRKGTSNTIVTSSLVASGVLGLIYTANHKYSGTSSMWRFGGALTLFIVFIGMGYMVSASSNKKEQ